MALTEKQKKYMREYMRNRRKTDPEFKERTNRQSLAYTKRNLDAVNERSRKYREKHKDDLKEYNKQYKVDNKERLTELQKDWVENNKEHIKEYSRKYHLKKMAKKKENAE